MSHKLTITLPDDIYRELQAHMSPDQISRLIEDLLRPYVMSDDTLESAYRAMAADTEREDEALEWIESAPDDGLA